MYRVSAVLALMSAITTWLLWWLPRQVPPPTAFDEALALATQPFYLARLWINFVHVFIALGAYAGAAAIIARRQPALAWAGLGAMFGWTFAEALGVSLNLWAHNAAWRLAYAGADAPTRDMIRTGLHLWPGLWDGIFFVVLAWFLLGTLTLGLGALAGSGLQRVVAVLLLLAVPLTVVILLDGYFGASTSRAIAWTYPVLQPLSRATMGVWIWQASR